MASRMISPRPAAMLPEGPYCRPGGAGRRGPRCPRGSASRSASRSWRCGRSRGARGSESVTATSAIAVSHAHGHHDRRPGVHHRVGQHLAHGELPSGMSAASSHRTQGRPDEQPGGRDRGRVVGEVLLRNPTHAGSSPGLGHVLPRTEGVQPMVRTRGRRGAGRRASPRRSRVTVVWGRVGDSRPVVSRSHASAGSRSVASACSGRVALGHGVGDGEPERPARVRWSRPAPGRRRRSRRPCRSSPAAARWRRPGRQPPRRRRWPTGRGRPGRPRSAGRTR